MKAGASAAGDRRPLHADLTATAGVDYTAIPPTTLTFNDQQTSQQITIPILDYPFAEGDETFLVELANATNAAGLGELAP